MSRSQSTLAVRTVEEIADADDLRAVIQAALAATPIDETMLRRGVWTYVGVERHAGTPPGRVLLALNDMIDEAAISPLSTRNALTRRVVLWGVEAYFGHLGGDVVGRDGRALSDAPHPVMTP